MKVLPLTSRSAPHNPAWQNQLFSAKAVKTGGIVRRRKRDVHRELGYAALLEEVRARGFHLVECGDQYLIICDDAHLLVHC
ncbi:MAG: hypothetical protein CML50_02210 [Rhodobacteraceae bacterium]|jgi:hypothetical protein|uniref:hypothetical protein n=1 Tax=Roseobacteraceae TaxID=2854170 RepID=UPI0008EF847A|nr:MULTISPECIES: hypothetical protein [Salipiger]MAB04819.1 hypothetical protein [Paracoccaceae bacterium]GGA13701.1 hypothetical protein GCM10011326_27250 [Salipiger profundus]SFD17629.1 hypothetical protein SAMN05444415_10862 [Salipiger profundus]|tara:strand:+ start:580 stop:822 length:243 start_codon:yes stop_codon:yes gene_type:complete